MDRTSRLRRRPLGTTPTPVTRTEPSTAASWNRAPIYASLVREWRAHGRTVPGQPDPLWAPFAGLPPRARGDEDSAARP